MPGPLVGLDGYEDPARFSTVRMGDIDGDGLADVCLRETDGVRCWTSTGEGFGADHYQTLQSLTAHHDFADQSDDYRAFWTQRREQTLRLRFFTSHVAPTFERVHGPRLDRAYAALDLARPDFGSLTRAETLAASMLFAAEDPDQALDLAELEADAMRADALLARVRTWAADRYDEGYERGIHDADAARILAAWLALRASAGLLRFSARARSLASLYLATAPDLPLDVWRTTGRMLGTLDEHLGPSTARRRFVHAVRDRMASYHAQAGLVDEVDEVEQAAEYLVEVLSTESGKLVFSESADALRRALRGWTDEHGGFGAFERSLGELSVADGLHMVHAYAHGVAQGLGLADDTALEAAALHVAEGRTAVRVAAGDNTTTVTGLLGQHANVQDGSLTIQLDRAGHTEWINDISWLQPARPQGASNMLSVIAGSMIGVASTLFSITIAAVAFGSFDTMNGKLSSRFILRCKATSDPGCAPISLANSSTSGPSRLSNVRNHFSLYMAYTR